MSLRSSLLLSTLFAPLAIGSLPPASSDEVPGTTRALATSPDLFPYHLESTELHKGGEHAYLDCAASPGLWTCHRDGWLLLITDFVFGRLCVMFGRWEEEFCF